MRETCKCDYCGEPAVGGCGKCCNGFYCCLDHRDRMCYNTGSLDWSFEIIENDDENVHLVARTNIDEATVILTEMPIATGPQYLTSPICLGCLKLLNVLESFRCLKCGFPFCSESCSENSDHYVECNIIEKHGRKILDQTVESLLECYHGILIIRCLYLRKVLPLEKTRFDKLEAQSREWEYDCNTDADIDKVIDCIYRKLDLESEFELADITKMYKLIKIYRHWIPASPMPFAGIYYLSSFVQQNCYPNCYKVVTKDDKIKIIAAKEIKAGKPLTMCYVCPLSTTMERQQRILAERLILCRCERCTDKTEFGTYFSALRCQKKYCRGLVLPQNFIEKHLEWTCSSCSFETTAKMVKQMLEPIRERSCTNKELWKTDEQLLAPHHSYMIKEMIRIIVSMDASVEGHLKHLSDNMLRLRIRLCFKVWNLLKLLVPADLYYLSVILTNLNLSLIENFNRKMRSGLLRNDMMIHFLEQRRQVVTEVMKATKFLCETVHALTRLELSDMEREIRRIHSV